MKAYLASKFLAKSIIATGVLAIVISTGAFFINKSTFKADSFVSNGCSLDAPLSVNSYMVSGSTDSIKVNLSGILSNKDFAYTITKQIVTSTSIDPAKITGSLNAGESKSEDLKLPSVGYWTVMTTVTDGFCSNFYSQSFNVSGYPQPLISVTNTNIQRGESYEVTLTNPSGENYFAHYFLTDGSGNYIEKTQKNIGGGSTIVTPITTSSDSLEGKHHIRVVVFHMSGANADRQVGYFETETCIGYCGPATPEETVTNPSLDTSPTPAAKESAGEPIKAKLTDLGSLFNNVYSETATIIGVLAFVSALVGGFMYLTAAGNEAQAERGKKTLIFTIIGIFLAVLSYFIVTGIINTINNAL